jgi:hypothetical protein
LNATVRLRDELESWLPGFLADAGADAEADADAAAGGVVAEA